MNVIGVFNNKGGVGKTTTSINLAHTLAVEFNYKVLVIDADGQKNLSAFFADKETKIDEMATFEKASVGEINIDACCKKTRYENIDMIFASNELNNFSEILAENFDSENLLNAQRARAYFKNIYDFVIIDLPPRIDLSSQYIMTFCDIILSPILLDLYSITGIVNVKSEATQFGNIKNIIYFVNQYDGKNKTQNELLDKIIKRGINICNSKIRRSRTISNEALYQQSAREIRKDKITNEYINLTNEILNKIK